MLAAGGEVWVADETALREFPPLRAGWSKRGTPATVLISGRNTRRTILGALQVSTGELVCTVRERCRTEDVLAAVAARGAVRPAVPKLLLWDNAPPHAPHRVRDAAAAASITVAFLPLPALPLPGVDAAGGLVAWAEGNGGRQPLLRLPRRAHPARRGLARRHEWRRPPPPLWLRGVQVRLATYLGAGVRPEVHGLHVVGRLGR